jgi:hypothetical protein
MNVSVSRRRVLLGVPALVAALPGRVSGAQSVPVRPLKDDYQVQIPNSRLVVIRSDAYHIAAANADECVNHTLAFLQEQKT